MTRARIAARVRPARPRRQQARRRPYRRPGDNASPVAAVADCNPLRATAPPAAVTEARRRSSQNVMGLRKLGFLGPSQASSGCWSPSDLEVAVSTRMKRMGALVGGAAVLSFGAYTIGSQGGNGVAHSRPNGSAQTAPVAYGRGGRPGPGARGLDQLASRLGVKAADLESALEAIRKSQPGPGSRDPRDDIAA